MFLFISLLDFVGRTVRVSRLEKGLSSFAWRLFRKFGDERGKYLRMRLTLVSIKIINVNFER